MTATLRRRPQPRLKEEEEEDLAGDGGGGAAAAELLHDQDDEVATEDGANFVRQPNGSRRPAPTREAADEDALDEMWTRVERIAEIVEDAVADTEDLMKESTSDRMNEVRRRRAAITKLVSDELALRWACV